MDSELREKYIEAARGMYADDDINVDSGAELSEADEGCWVSAWVWVRKEDVDDGSDED